MTEIDPASSKSISPKMILGVLRRQWWVWLLVCTTMTAGGWGVSHRIPTAYTSTSTFFISSSESSIADLISKTNILGALAGGAGKSDIHLRESLESKDFLLPLLDSKWPVDTQGVFRTMPELFSINLTGIKPLNSLADSAYIVNEICVGILRKKIKLIEDAQSGVMSLSITVGDPVFAHELNKAILERIKNFNNQNRLGKVSRKVLFIKNQLEGFERTMAKSEQKLVLFKNENKTFDSPELIAKFGMLERDLQIATSVVVEFRKQYEMAKIDEQTEQEYIEVVSAPSVPLSPSSPGAKKLAIVGLLLGLIASGIITMLTIVFSSEKKY